MLHRISRIVVCASSIVSAPALLAVPAMAANTVPSTPAISTTLSFTMKEIGGGIGYEWGKGQLSYQGRSYDFTIGGGGLASLGYIQVQGNGTVDDLSRLSDFDGTYWTVKAAAAAGSGTGVAVLENQFGVRLTLHMKMQGAHVSASVMRLRFRLVPTPEEAKGDILR